jgi:hypothetical protein
MVQVADVAPGSAFLDTDGNGNYFALKLKPEGTSSAWVTLSGESLGAMTIVPREHRAWVLELTDVEVDIDDKDLGVSPGTSRAKALGLLPLGALTVVKDDCRIVVSRQGKELLMASLRTGDVYPFEHNEPIAVANAWQLVRRIGNETREILRIDTAQK